MCLIYADIYSIYMLHGFEPLSSQINGLKIDTQRFLARCKDWLTQCQDNVTESDIRSWWDIKYPSGAAL